MHSKWPIWTSVNIDLDWVWKMTSQFSSPKWSKNMRKLKEKSLMNSMQKIVI